VIEVRGNLFDPPPGTYGIVLTTNGDVRKDRQAVMGRGVALQAKQRWPEVAFALGWRLLAHGNVPHRLTDDDRQIASLRLPYHLYTMPVKHHWFERANVHLISDAALALRALVPPAVTIALPRPGCGNGGLPWHLVKEILTPVFTEDRFQIIHPE
jgi:hypothetical protein